MSGGGFDYLEMTNDQKHNLANDMGYNIARAILKRLLK